jgi:hypothetical protein
MSLAAVPGCYLLPVDVTIGDILDVFPGRVDVLDSVTDKRELLDVVAFTLEFPGYWRPNWDSFEECLLDLSWLAPGPRVLVLTACAMFAERDPDGWDVALSVFARAVRTHAHGGAPLHVFLLG